MLLIGVINYTKKHCLLQQKNFKSFHVIFMQYKAEHNYNSYYIVEVLLRNKNH